MSYVQRTQDLSGLNPAWSSQAAVMNAVVQEVDDGNVVFEWDSADVPSLYTDSTSSNTFTSSTVSDNLHMNSMTIDPTDGNFIFSFRYTSSIVKNRPHERRHPGPSAARRTTSASRRTRSSRGSTTCAGSPMGRWVFDNGNNLHQTRIVPLLDEDAKTVTSFTHVYDKPADQPQTSFMGAYTRFDGSRELFGWTPTARSRCRRSDRGDAPS